MTVRAQSIADLQRGFERPPDDAKIMMRWWWFGPAVTKSELERELRLMKEGGIGGFEVQPVYPLLPDDPAAHIKNLPYLSDEFIDSLRFVSIKAKELGLRMDLTLGSGWPYGGPQVPITEAAATLRSERVKVQTGSRRIPLPNLMPAEKFLAAFLGERELTDIHDGAVWLPAEPQSSQEVLFFISGRTGMQVKRPAVGAEGYVLNHLDRQATEHYLKNVGDRLMQAFGSNPPYAIFCDSLEVYNQDWTPDFLDEFKRRRGYDLKPLLPTLITDFGPKTYEIRRDWGKTLTELYNERFLQPLHDWARRNKTLLRVQNYGVPAVTLSGYANVDLPEGEGAQWKVVRGTRWASSASHIYGRRVTSSETWTWLHSPSFRATPLDMKAEADRHFLMGINQLIGHGWPYTAEGVEYPGWRFYAAAVFDEKNPWWIVMPDIASYLQRASFLLRQGTAVNDVAVYLSNNDGWAHFTSGNPHLIEILRERVGTQVLSTILDSGYNFDFFDDEVLMQTGRVEQNSLVLGSARYRVVVLPNVERIPLETMRKLEEFTRNGGIVIATRGDEKELLRSKLTSALQPDMSLTPAVADIGFVHRRAGESEIYFVANTTNVRQVLKATFRVQDMKAEWWDLFSGQVRPAKTEATSGSGTTVALDLEPYGSRVLVFSKRTLPAPPVATTAATVAQTIDLNTGWRVSFGATTKPVLMDQLRSWTDDESTRYFSGTATYEKDVLVSDGFLRSGSTARLDFGEGKAVPEQTLRAGMQAWFDAPVREAAVIYVNEQRAGSVWCPPYALDVTKFLRPGNNKLRIVVANLAVNYMAGRRLPDYRLLNLRYGERFQAQDMDKVQAIPSGLFGPIQLVSYVEEAGTATAPKARHRVASSFRTWRRPAPQQRRRRDIG